MNRKRISQTGSLGFKILPPFSSVKSSGQLPSDFYFAGYPNPFNPEVKLKYSLPSESLVKIEIFNSMGERIKILESKVKKRGIYEINWNPGPNSSGIYYARMNCGSVINNLNFYKTIKLIYLK